MRKAIYKNMIIRNLNIHLLSGIELEEPYLSIFNIFEKHFKHLKIYERTDYKGNNPYYTESVYLGIDENNIKFQITDLGFLCPDDSIVQDFLKLNSKEYYIVGIFECIYELLIDFSNIDIEYYKRKRNFQSAFSECNLNKDSYKFKEI